MSAAVRWYVVVQLLGSTAFILIAPASRRLADSGYALSKALGILLCGVTLWIGTALGLLRNEPGGAWLAALAVGMAAFVMNRWRAADAGARGRSIPIDVGWRVVITIEALFLLAFAGWCVVRAFDPAVNHTEQPMDLMLLTATANAPIFPPQDPWLAGYPISYYYLGYWLMSALGHLSGVPPHIAYNVGQACWFALLNVTCFGLAYNVVGYRSQRRGGALAMFGGLLACVMVAAAGNLVLPTALIGRWLAGIDTASLFSVNWWWWQSSRAVQDVSLSGQPIEVITEFPIFSYVLGDNHPHVLAMPFVALASILAFNVFIGGEQDPPRERWLRHALALLVITTLIPLNTWDFPGVLLLYLLVLLRRWRFTWRPLSWPRQFIAPVVSIALVLFLVTLTYAATAQSQLTGVLPNLFHPTNLRQFALTLGTILPGVVVAARLMWIDSHPSVRHVAWVFLLGLVACATSLATGALWAALDSSGGTWFAAIAPGISSPQSAAVTRWARGWPVTALIAAGIATGIAAWMARVHRRREGAESIDFLILLATVGWVLVLVPEMLYARDVFTNRMNTVFKFYYQAWLLLGVTAAVAIATAFARDRISKALALVALLPVSAGLVYAPRAIADKIDAAQVVAPTLDALDFLRRDHADEFAALEWVRSHTQPTDVIVQAAGQSYQAGDSRLSMASGRPTLLGWQGHERQWRGERYEQISAGRTAALARIYNPVSDDDLRGVLLDWDIRLVLVGARERQAYSMTAAHGARLERVMDLGFTRGTIRVYRRRG